MSTADPAPLYVDVHVVQTVPPSNLNRDDAGSPKQATFGGARRARVSSQAWKRATRTEFARLLPADQLATRTKKVPLLLAERVADRTGLTPDAASRLATHLLNPLGISPGKKDNETAYLLFVGRAQLDRVVDLVADRADELAALDDAALDKALAGLPVRDQFGTGHPIDVALFGRMVADIPEINVDAATQVAHALSTHPVEIEFDYFTAVDDENPKEDTGAGMIGTVEFNSATLYRFATVGVHQLLENLGGDLDAAMEALQAFLVAFVRSMPTGHQHSFAHHTVPNLVTITLRDTQPVNLVSAFEAPVHPTRGLVAQSIRRLADELLRAADLWGLPARHVATTYSVDPTDATLLEALGEPLPFDTAVANTIQATRAVLTAGANG